jgi:hypothetical protein
LFTKLRGALFFLIENYVNKNIGFDVVFLKVANFHTMTTIKNTMQLTQRIAFGKNDPKSPYFKENLLEFTIFRLSVPISHQTMARSLFFCYFLL